MATVAQLKQRVKDRLYGAYHTDRPFSAELGASHNSSVTSITVDDGGNWFGGDILENPGTDEQMYVKSVSSNTLTVIRGFNGTTAASSSGSDDLIHKNPRFASSEITDALNQSLKSLQTWGIHGIAYETVTRNDAQKDFWELAATDIDPIYGVLEVYYVEDNTEQPRPLPFRYRQQLGTAPTEYGVGYGVLILDYGNVKLNEDFEVVYAQVFDALTEPTNGDQEELLVLGACVILLGGQIIPASQDPGARTDRTVPVGQLGRDVRHFQSEYYVRVRAEAGRVAVQRDKYRPSTVRSARARRWRN